MLIREAELITGGLSRPSKMPGRAFNISAFSCKRGSALAKIPTAVCSKCYARKGRYSFKNIKNALEKRLIAFEHPKFIQAMVVLINKQSPEYFRWFDSGDLQDEEMLSKIILICRFTPDTKHWLPTREHGIINNYVRKNGVEAIPSNLNIRVSDDLFDLPTRVREIPGVTYSAVIKNAESLPEVFNCLSPKQNNKCKECRACWSKEVKAVAYKAH